MLTISYCLNSWLPVLLVESGRSQTLASLSVSIFSFGGMAAALGVGALIDRFGAARTLVTFLVISTAILFALGSTLATASTTTLILLLSLSGFFVLGAYGGINVVLAGFYPQTLRATGIGWAKSIGRVGTVVAPVAIGLGLSGGVSETLILSLFAIPAALSALSVAMVERARNRTREGSSPFDGARHIDGATSRSADGTPG
jgi:MFS family permease